ncbi:MAG: hypothetical protein ACYDGR_14465 [Candidatus Dormibacteria bacterium]
MIYGLALALLMATGVVVAVLVAGRTAGSNAVPGHTAAAGLSPSAGQSPPYAGVGDTAEGGQGQAIDNIKCENQEQFVYHVHAHLAILMDGKPEPVARFIGIPGQELGVARCIYWMHTHDSSGIIHIESPNQSLYTLGEFFDIWGMPLGRNGVATLPVPGGDLLVFVDGAQYQGDPRQIELKAHTEVVIELGSPVPPPSFDFGHL